ncbi:MAG: hypothetical protein H7X88_05115 [Gloeobacteraceae cyanobacterium ES-bin-316]|nr:hypothetical protein [Ferruginibacter sp.]
MRTVLLFLVFYGYSFSVGAQLTVSGTVLDKSKINRVENVRVLSTGGMFTTTDSMGRYSILVKPGDSISFVYKNKPTQPFEVNSITDLQQFDISLHLDIQSKYSVLKEVVVYSKSYKEDSLENRQTYADVFSYEKPGLSTSINPGGAVGADVNELINIFRFRRNKRLKAFQQRLELQEQEKYIDYRFNKITVGRITGLSGSALDSFLVWYRPSYEFAQMSSEIIFNEYVLNASYQYRKIMPFSEAKKEE